MVRRTMPCIHEALEEMEKHDEPAARLVKLRYFGAWHIRKLLRRWA
jgi:hypothetical protein